MFLSRVLLFLVFIMNVSSAMEIRSPVCPVGYGNLPCIINGTNSPGLLEDYEMIYFNISNGYYLAGDNFYYSGVNYKNTKIDLFSKEYNIVSIDSMEAVLTTDIYENENNFQIKTGNELRLNDGYMLELVDTGKDGAIFSLKRNDEILEISSINMNEIFSYKAYVDGREVEIFHTKLIGIFGNGTIIEDTYLRDVKVIKNGEYYDDYKIALRDINGDDNIDIVYSLEDKKIDLNDDEVIRILGDFMGMRTYHAYVPFYKSIESFNLTGDDGKFRIFSLSNNISLPVASFLNSPPEGSIIASGMPVRISTKPSIVYNISNSSISELRGDHTFYIYTKGNLSLSVTKQDLNWYNGSDNLEVKLYSSSNSLLKNITVPDDGNTGNNNTKGMLQNGTLEGSLEEGVYKVTMTGGSDILIKSIDLNAGKIVVQKPYLAGGLYNNATRFSLYTKALKGERLGFYIAHNNPSILPQTVNISSGSFAQSLNITMQNVWYYIDLPPVNEIYQVDVPSGDIMINSSNSYFSFSADSYFNPETVKILPLQNNMNWLNKNMVDYVIIPSSNPFEAAYFFKINSAQELNVSSPESPWNDHTLDTWSAPNIFYFNPDENNTWEYLMINNTGTDLDVEYASIQNEGYVGYRGNFFKVMEETPGELILSKKISDMNNKTLFLGKEWQVGGVYTLTLEDIDIEGSALLQLNRSNKPVSKQIIPRGKIMEYKISHKGKYVTIFQSKLDGIFQGTDTSFVKLSDVQLYDENMLTIKNGESIDNEKNYLLDLNNDSFLDILVKPDIAIRFEKNSRKTLFNSYLDIIYDENTFHVERKINSLQAVTDISNIKKEIKYTFTSFFPQYNATMSFSDFDITGIIINAARLIDQISIDIKELKDRPENIVIGPEGDIYKYFSISIEGEEIKSKIVNFRVNKSWIKYENIDPDSIAFLELHEGSWENLPTFEVNSDKRYTYYSATISDSSTLFTIVGTQMSKKGSFSLPILELKPDEKEFIEQENLTHSAKDVDNGKSGNIVLVSLVLFGYMAFSGYFINRNFEILKNNKITAYLSRINGEMFNSLLLTFFILIIAENIWNTSVSKYINLNYLMIILFFYGIASLFGDKMVSFSGKKSASKEYLITAIIGISTMMVIWLKIKDTGIIAYPISIISGILIMLFCIMMAEGNTFEQQG